MPTTAGITRRQALQTSLAAALTVAFSGSRAQVMRASQSQRWLLLGDSSGQGIYRASWNATTGEIGLPELAAATPQPTYLVRHPHLPLLYACNETDSATTSALSAFRLNPQTAALQPLTTQLTHGASPCYASVNRTASLLFTANYGGGNLSVFPLGATGQLGPAATVFDCKGNAACGTTGPAHDRQDAPHLHCAVLSPDNRFVLACDLGEDVILAFPIRPESAQPLGPVTRIPTAPGAGPRHLAFHPNGHWLYCINELDCTVVQYLWQTRGAIPSAQPIPGGTTSVRAAAAPKETPSTGAELAFTRDGRFLYTSTRGADVLTVFRVDGRHGQLRQIQQISCGGRTPRFFALDPTEQWLLCTHQDGNSIAVFQRDRATGMLTPHTQQSAVNPECLLWL